MYLIADLKQYRGDIHDPMGLLRYGGGVPEPLLSHEGPGGGCYLELGLPCCEVILVISTRAAR